MSKFNVGDKVRQIDNGPYLATDRVKDKVGTVEIPDDESPYPVTVRFIGSDDVLRSGDPDFELWPFKEDELDLVLDA